jgi:nucleoside-diphosphate-sugar epimerase
MAADEPRPAAVYGPGDEETLPFFRALARGMAVRLNRQDAVVGLVHVADLAAAIARALASGGEGEIFEIDDGVAGGHSWSDMLRIGGEAVGRRPFIVPVPRPALWAAAFAARLLGGLSGSPHILSAGKVREIHHVDWSRRGRAFSEIGGWFPTVDLEHGFRQTADSYRRAGRL